MGCTVVLLTLWAPSSTVSDLAEPGDTDVSVLLLSLHRNQLVLIHTTGFLASYKQLMPALTWCQKSLDPQQKNKWINKCLSEAVCIQPDHGADKHRVTPCCPRTVSALSLDSVLILLKTASVYLISALRGLYKVLSFKNGPSVQKHFLHSCSAHQLSEVWRGAAALWMCSQIWKHVRGCFSCSDGAEWSDVWTDWELFIRGRLFRRFYLCSRVLFLIYHNITSAEWVDIITCVI